VVGYTAAQLRDEIVATAKDNKGRVGSAWGKRMLFAWRTK
jgi:hypothetical protein